jgi:hypothetical protein
MKKLTILVLIVLIGCAKGIVLTDSQSKNINILKAHIPIRTHVTKAKAVMEKSGFICKIQKNESIELKKRDIQIGSISGDFLVCEKEEKDEIWRVIFMLENDKVKDIAVSKALK